MVGVKWKSKKEDAKFGIGSKVEGRSFLSSLYH
ncbi:hypothetical protein LSS_01632 [Leptospira santarosai serovar Shermani str. LT 821]|uniref:Uncharacterized protein n=1 Tax=Leptospira santarosai serovar Shermani str. LT 821 TaxID=758847 RepID=K8YDV2_9LEPT|nr:hypothetical protein LSS_01632 [Leptospira santarosai serovar Shermani str. LT 821]